MQTTATASIFDTLCARLHVEPDSRGEAWIACPWCSKANKHFSFSERGFCCFVCDEKGRDLRKLAAQLNISAEMPLRRAVRHSEPRKLPRRWQYAPERHVDEFCAALDRVPAWQSYKPLSLDSIARYRLGVGVLPASRCARRRLILPVYQDGRCVALHGRAYQSSDDDTKWLCAGGSDKRVLFVAGELRPGCTLILVENYVDAILTAQAVPDVVAAALGGASWQEAWTEQVAASRPKQVLTWLDHDLAGNGSRWHHRELVAEWRAKNPKARRIPEPRGPKIANDLIAAGVRATLYEWPRGTPLHADIGWSLMQERKAA